MPTSIAGSAVLMLISLAAAQPPASAPEVPPERPFIAFPHPLITEVLYAVPTGPEGDASGDGVRDAVGDEFIEIVNPHSEPIQLRGYALTDRQQVAKRDGRTFTSIRFVFPAFELEPGEVVVLFNGHRQQLPGPVGDSARVPAGNPRFGGARVFTMNNVSARSGFANGADCVTLWSPAGRPVHSICWGEAQAPPQTDIVEQVPALTGQSVTRLTIAGPMVAHPAPTGGSAPPRRFSPGVFPPSANR
jgi:hypothetical protein